MEMTGLGMPVSPQMSHRLTQGQVHGYTSAHPVFSAANTFWAVLSLT